MSCRLCNRDLPLRNSHIFPEFLYRPLYDEKHRAIGLTPERLGKGLIQKGLREQLLCDDCEQHLGRLESYFAKLWYGPPILPARPAPPAIQLTGLDYPKVKLFILSLLWRASVCSLTEFSQVQLGPHEEAIRHALERLDPLTPDDYLIVGSVLTGPAGPDLIAPTIMTPIRHRYEGMNLYVMAFGSCAWHCYLSKHVRLSTNPAALSPAGEIILLVADLTEFGPIDSFMRKKAEEERRRSLRP